MVLLFLIRLLVCFLFLSFECAALVRFECYIYNKV